MNQKHHQLPPSVRAVIQEAKAVEQQAYAVEREAMILERLSGLNWSQAQEYLSPTDLKTSADSSIELINYFIEDIAEIIESYYDEESDLQEELLQDFDTFKEMAENITNRLDAVIEQAEQELCDDVIEDDEEIFEDDVISKKPKSSRRSRRRA